MMHLAVVSIQPRLRLLLLIILGFVWINIYIYNGICMGSIKYRDFVWIELIYVRARHFFWIRCFCPRVFSFFPLVVWPFCHPGRKTCNCHLFCWNGKEEIRKMRWQSNMQVKCKAAEIELMGNKQMRNHKHSLTRHDFCRTNGWRNKFDIFWYFNTKHRKGQR